MDIPAKKRYLAIKKLNHSSFSINGKFYGYTSGTKEAFEIPKAYISVLDKLNNQYALIEDIYDKNKEEITAEVLLVILNDLLKTGFISVYAKHLEPISSFNLHLSTHCNLNCIYCYGGLGRDDSLSGGSYGFKKEHMSLEMGKKAVDYLLKTSSIRSNHSTGGINFFGGEPLMNKDVLSGIVEYAEEQALKFAIPPPSFGITTNGLLVNDEFLDLCQKHKIGVQISFDGTPEAQNFLRPTGGQQASYPFLSSVFKLLKDRKIPVKVRATVSKVNISLIDSIYHLEKIGVDKVHFAPASGEELGSMALDEHDIDTLTEAYIQIADYSLERIKSKKKFVYCNNLFSLLGQIHRQKEKFYACGAGIGLVSIMPDGHFYVCHRFAGMEKFDIGDIETGIDFRKRLAILEQLNVNSHDECRECWAKNLCGGECPASNYDYNFNVNTPHKLFCILHKSLVQIAVYLGSEIRQFDEEVYFNLVESGY